jgi:hypothetical protein
MLCFNAPHDGELIFYIISKMSAQRICLGVEIGQDWLKVALVEPERKNVIKIDAIPTSGDPAKDVSVYTSVISSWIRSNPVSKIGSVAAALPACNNIMRLIPIPKEAKNVSDYINWEFASAINSEPNSYHLDIALYPNEKKPERAIVTAVRKKFISLFLSVKSWEYEFRPSCMVADVCALLNLLESSEGLGSQPKCVLKADEKFVMAFWGNETGPLAVRILPKSCISASAIVEILESGYKEFPKASKNIKLCGELCANYEFTTDLVMKAKELKNPLEIHPWNSLSKFSMEKNGDFSKLSQCMGAIGATLNCIWEM